MQRISVKHLNPRQGITTDLELEDEHIFEFRFRVKHLNPRQGITTSGQKPSRCRASAQFV